jgi:ATP-dependent protease ClpP protease subunit
MNPPNPTPPAFPQGGVIYITFNSMFDDRTVNKLMLFCTNLIANLKPKCLYFLFSSSGGAIDPAIAFYNFLRSLPCEIVMHNMSIVASSATVVFHAADKRYSSLGSTFHFHGLTWTFGAQEALNSSRLEELQSMLTEGENKMAAIIQSRCKLTEDMIRGMFKQGQSKDNVYALSHGIIQEVCELKIPSNAITLTFTVD